MNKKFSRLLSFALVLLTIFSSTVTYAKTSNDINVFYGDNGQSFTEDELIDYIISHKDEIYKVSDDSNFDFIALNDDYDAPVFRSATLTLIPAWAVGKWVIPLVGAVIITPEVIKLGNQIIDASSKLFDTIIFAIENITFSSAKTVSPKDKLPNQGEVTDKKYKNKTAPVDAGKQGKHVPGHNNNNKNKSQWPKGTNGVQETQEAWEKGRFVKDDNSVKTYDFGRKVGPNGETRVKVHGDSKGLIHGYPVH